MPSMASQARAWLQKRKNPATLAQIRRALKIKPKDTRTIRQLGYALQYLYRTGKIKRICPGTYQYREKPYTPPPLRAIIWRAIRNERQFTIADIQLISGACYDYVNEYIQYLAKTGYLVKTKRFRGRKPIYSVKVLARGRGQKIRGLRNRQHRPDLVVMDDIENDQSVRNPRQVEKALKWIRETVYPAIDQQGSLFIIGTLLARKSVLAQLIHGDDYKEWISRVYQALSDDNKPLWPERHSLKSLLHKKAVIGSVSFNKEYQNDPRDDEGMFREEWLRQYHPSEIQGRQLAVFTFIDPSVGSGESHDYKAIITIGQDTNGIIYVLDAYIRKASIDAMLLVTYNRYGEFHPQTIGIEDNVFQKLLLREFDAMARQRRQYLPLRGVTHTTAKESRVGRLSALIERGIIRFQKGHSDQDLLIEQLIYFPSSTVNDDGPDALEGAVDMANAGPAVCLGVEATRETYQAVRPRLFG